MLSRVKFLIKVGSDATNTSGPWLDFDSFACIERWDGILSEGPIKGDIIEMDWRDGAEWQRGPAKPYSFDVPFTCLVSVANNPNIWDSYSGFTVLKPYRGPLLILRREFYNTSGILVRADQTRGVLINDLPARIGVGRVVSGTAVFQNLGGAWTEGVTLPVEGVV